MIWFLNNYTQVLVEVREKRGHTLGIIQQGGQIGRSPTALSYEQLGSRMLADLSFTSDLDIGPRRLEHKLCAVEPKVDRFSCHCLVNHGRVTEHVVNCA